MQEQLMIRSLQPLNEISETQGKPTEKTRKKCERLLDYVATYPNVRLRFHVSDMKLYVDSDAVYLVTPKAKSRFLGYYNSPNRKLTYNKVSGTNNPLLV